ncbi:methionyl-tRNA formyltransferase [Halosimplex pelagicum]|uniref:Methionyl-tRNA formyltransferase n=1 Tax=Halosimplex pelagicum TaxID=869886 RepID=A0A7D5P594_9EURY|nr:methionyl-tRNA formyltransferase [Halosimplex pelagicum]QLH81206.1 methionyl-tRNA formyltransferase [Halosimplex pelagicum]
MDIVFVTQNKLGLRCIRTLHDIGASITTIYTLPDVSYISDQVKFEDVAEETNADLRKVSSVNDPGVVEQIVADEPDFLFVVGWSRLVEQSVIDIPEIAVIGMHPTPLPRGRGRAPVAWNLIKGYDETSLSMFRLVEKADAGPVYATHEIPITRRDDASSLNEKIFDAGETLIRDHYRDIADGNLAPTPQQDSEATWWPKRDPNHGLIDWTRSAETVHNWIRGQTHPYPGAFSYLRNTKITVWKSKPPSGETVFATPGEIIDVRGDELAVAAWEEVIEIETVQLPDGPEMPAASLVREYQFEISDVFERVRDRTS